MFEIKNLSRTFGTQKVLDNLSFTIQGGMNFIIGPSGSGKTTLLKILSAMDTEFTGDVHWGDVNMKNLSSVDRQQYYNSVFGFISQSFNLIDTMTVYENMCLPGYLKNGEERKQIIGLLKTLKIDKLVDQKVKKLSGGQRQRVAIARELLKNPQVIIADEPTAALDPKTAQEIIEILRSIAKTKMVIVVTHDTTLIDPKASVFELDKGELTVVKQQNAKEQKVKVEVQKPHLSARNNIRAALVTLKRFWGRSLAMLLAIMVCTGSLCLTLGGSIDKTVSGSFEELKNKYGNSLLDMTIASSFMGAGASADSDDMDGKNNGNKGNKGGSQSVTQDISSVYEKFLGDPRVEYILLDQYIWDTSFILDDKLYNIETSGSTPAFKELLTGRMPTGDGMEVIISSAAVKKMGLTNEGAIGKEIVVKGNVFDYNTQKKPVELRLTIVGVVDANIYVSDNFSFEQEDCMFFSKSAAMEIVKQSGKDLGKSAITIHANTPEDLISLKDELMKDGIVPLGRFELVEDIVRLNAQAKEQSGVGNSVISILAVFAALAVCLVTALFRKREFAIYKINGFGTMQIMGIVFSEFTAITIIGVTLGAIVFALTDYNVVAGFGAVLFAGTALVCTFLTGAVAHFTNTSKALRTGER